MFRKLMSTTDEFAITILRVLFGVVFLVGLLGRVAAFGIACNTVAVALIHRHIGFFGMIKGSATLPVDRTLSKA
jgi:uncharacterized membrane protein YphA (DoxX/SURF4 family)